MAEAAIKVPQGMNDSQKQDYHCRQGSRNTRYQAGAAPYLGRSSTGWIAPACLAHSFDHLVGAGENRIRHGQAEGLGGLEIDDELEPG
jgi:hypothetical protein